jgi:plastocyanin
MRFHIAVCLCAMAAIALFCTTPRAQETDAENAGEVVGKADEQKPVKKDIYIIEIKDHKFSPAELVVPAGKKLKLQIVNLDSSAEEFESYDLNREKVVAGGRKIIVFIGPLKPGTYSYFGEFHPETAQGLIIAK